VKAAPGLFVPLLTGAVGCASNDTGAPASKARASRARQKKAGLGLNIRLLCWHVSGVGTI
jgi:hypothetical protein